MRGIWGLFRADLRRATSNVMSIIVLCGLIVIPSVFTWFNVVASWEPFDNTKNLKIAVASVDEGYTSSLLPLHVNIGSLVESNLRANDQMDWIITSKKDAVAGTESGEYYAAMVLPEDFSERMLTFYSAGSKRTEIEYYTNDKSNPLAPIITNEGADDLSAKINQEFTKELGSVALALVDSLANSLDNPDSQATFAQLDAQIESVSTQLSGAASTAELFSALLSSTVPLAESSISLLNTVDDEFNAANGRVQQGLGSSQAVQQAIDTATQALSEAFTASNTRLDGFETEVNGLFSTMGTQAGATSGKINDISADVGKLVSDHQTFRDRLAEIEERIAEVEAELPLETQAMQASLTALLNDLDTAIAREKTMQDRLAQASTAINDGNTKAQETRDALIGDIGEARTALSSANTTYVDEVRPLLEALATTLVDVQATFGSLALDLDNVTSVADGSVSVLEAAATDTDELSKALSKSADTFAKVHSDLSAAIKSGDVEKIAQVIGSNPATLAGALAQPIGVDRIPVFPVVSFGAGMAPLYTMLSLWVGALLISVTLRVEPPTRAFDGGPELKLHQQFLGRYGIFALIGFAQSSLVFLGNILMVGLDPVHPFLFMLTGWLTSLTFTFVIYTLVVSFSDAGKALAVFLLVIQVAGAGGAYPLSLLPHWFQNISPYLPGTHSINAIRASMAGIYENDYWISIGWLFVFIAGALVLGLLLRKPLIGFNKKMEAALQSTKLM